MLTDNHCHILPQIDDGSVSVDMSLQMVEMMRKQGVERIIATPHFYAHREESVDAYLARRQNAYNELVKSDSSCSDILLGAEIAVEYGISSLAGIEKLRMADTDYILFELPYTLFSQWYLNEITDISYGFGLTPIIAHVHRCIDYYSKSELEELLRLDAVFQINNEAFGNHKERQFVKNLIKEGYPYLFGSDAHNLSGRRPNWDLLKKKVRADVIDNAEVILRQL